MTTYLHAHCGMHQVLISAGEVLAIEDAATTDAGGNDLATRLWRGRQLPVITLNTLLGGITRGQHQIVLGHDDADPDARIVEVARVTTLVEIDGDGFSPLADYDARLTRLVDAVHLPPAHLSGQAWLRLRLPIDKQLADMEAQP